MWLKHGRCFRCKKGANLKTQQLKKPKYRIDIYDNGAIIRLKDRRITMRKDGNDCWGLIFTKVLSVEEAALDLPVVVVRKNGLQHTAINLSREALMGVFVAIDEIIKTY